MTHDKKNIQNCRMNVQNYVWTR